MSSIAEEITSSAHDIVELRRGSVRTVTLVRPDGYVAFTADALQAPNDVRDSVRSLLALQIRDDRESLADLARVA